ncbi:RING-HC_RNF170 domain-containing protein isoform X2 [Lampris incognitus]|uniref:RING-HC_RNF170 domain-containing protein isoform X2 n=1 Tax=Lampris incognitus TaxID=2546036 RepID=UPI0024B4B5C8|nr:RING-HC_RNF170 domain-containing protein isoform X2 [Lampris incognitus]
MHPQHSSEARQDPRPDVPVGNPELRAAEPATPTHTCRHKFLQTCSAMSHRDWHCPVCLQTASFPVQTNCGHLFCAPCLITYWRHGSWLDAISCPLCRQKVSVLCRLFTESRSDGKSKEVLGYITDYNSRYSGAPRRLTDYLCDAPLLLQLLARGLGTMGGLVWLFFFRVALCCVGTVVSFSSPHLETVPSSANQLETDPSLCGLLGVLDDLVVVILLLICVININQQMAPETGSPTRATPTHGLLGNSM